MPIYNVKSKLLHIVFFLLFGCSFFLLFVYSYAHIDLNLTLSSHPTYQALQQQLLYLGYFQRPLSTGVFLSLLFLLFFFYMSTLLLAYKKQISQKAIFLLIGVSVVLLFLAYPAFSHDIFNYMFDARIVTKYQENPYLHAAQDFPHDPWTRFMHWTHRTYPYGPLWLAFTIPFSFLGFEKFTLTLFYFKLFFALFHLGIIFLILRIQKILFPKNEAIGVLFYALNPLVLIESLVSPHNEVIMVFFLLLALYFLLVKRFWWAIGMLVISGGIKFVTLLLLPFFLFPNTWKRIVNQNKQFFIMLVFLTIALIGEILFREPYSWYFLPLLAFVGSMFSFGPFHQVLIGVTLASLLRYAPYLYMGDYSVWVETTRQTLFALVLGVTAIVVLFFWRRQKYA